MYINAYDFDGTIYNGDCTIDFFVYCLKKNPIILSLLPKQFFSYILFKLKLKEKKDFKEDFYEFLRLIKNIDNEINCFWEIHIKKIKKFYLNQKMDNDLIISASPDFLLRPLCKMLEINYLISSAVDKKTGKLLGPNCYGEEKVRRYHCECKNIEVENFYSDSFSDMPMARISKKSYIIKNNKIKDWS